MTTLPELSRRVSEADGPSRELDLQVSAALFWRPEWIDTVRTAMAPEGTVWFRPGCHDKAMTLHRDWTSSLDAVAALIAEKLPGCGWQIGQTEEDMDFRCWARVLKRSALFAPPNGVAATPALALLSAALLAIHERNKSDDQ